MSILFKRRPVPVFYKHLVFFGILFFLSYGCTTSVKPPPTPPGHPKPYKIGRNWYQPLPHARGFEQRGKASWYGKEFHGRKTSNGEIYNMYAMTAAHKTLPFDTYVSVRNLENNKKIKVRINDRGPFARNRIIDLTYAGAKKLGMVGPGTAYVEIIALGPSSKTVSSDNAGQSSTSVNYYKGNFTVQIGAFSQWENAENLKKKLARSYKNAHITAYYDGNKTLYRVRVGQCSTLEEADQYEELMIKNGFENAFAIAEDH